MDADADATVAAEAEAEADDNTDNDNEQQQQQVANESEASHNASGSQDADSVTIATVEESTSCEADVDSQVQLNVDVCPEDSKEPKRTLQPYSMRLATVSTSSSSIVAEFNKIARLAPGRSTSLRTSLNALSSLSALNRATSRPSKLLSDSQTKTNTDQELATDSDSATQAAAGLDESAAKSLAEQCKGPETGKCAYSPTDNEKSGGDSFETVFKYRQNDSVNRYAARPYSSYLSSRRYYDYYRRGRMASQSQSMPTLTKDLSKSTSSFLELEPNENGSLNNSTDKENCETEEEKKECCCEANGEQDDTDKQSVSSELNAAEVNNTSSLKLTKRYHIIAELVSVETDYVDSLKVINNKYLPALKSTEFWDANVAVERMFSGISQIINHHEQLLQELHELWDSYNENQTTLGDKFLTTFRRPEIVDTYCNFIEHFDNAVRFLDVSLLSRPAFVKFEEEFRKETGVKLPLMALLIKPAQRIPRYELLLKRLADHTDQSHADRQLLTEAIEVVHKVAVNINDVQVAQDKRIVTLKSLEDLLGIDLATNDRNYLRHDVVQLQCMQSEKVLDSCHLLLFTDILVIATVKKKNSGSLKNSANFMLHYAGGGHEFVEANTRFKVVNQPQLTDVNVIPDISTLSKRKNPSTNQNQQQTELMVQLISDRSTVEQMLELSIKISLPHQPVDDALRDLLNSLNSKLGRLKLDVARDRKVIVNSPSACKLTLCTGNDQKLYDAVFQNAERKAAWEKAFNEAKSHLNKSTDL